MKHTSLKKLISVLLSAALILSCGALGIVPSASVAGPSSTYGNTVPSNSAPAQDNLGKYRVRLLIHEDDGFDKSLHDNDSYVAGITYGLNNSKRNLNGTSKEDDNNEYWCEYAKINYKDMNGTGTESAVWFNMGDKDASGHGDIISSGGQDYGYYPSVDGVVISGFPTSFTTRYYEKGNGSGGYTVYLQVATWTSATEWEWPQGTCTSTGFLGIGGWNSDNAGGVFQGSTGSIKTVNTGTELKLAVTLMDESKYPKAETTPSAVTYSPNTVTCPASSSDYETATLEYDSPKDQYGAVMAAKITTQCDYRATGITQSGNLTKIGFAANILNTYNAQNVKATVTWVQHVSSSQLSRSATLRVNDAVYSVTWRNYLGEEIANETYAFGDMPSAPLPIRQAGTYHYINAHWTPACEQVTADSVKEYTAAYDTVAHNYDTFEPFNDLYHKAICQVDAENPHSMLSEHAYEDQAVAPGCESKGYTLHTCTACGHTYTDSYVNPTGHHWDDGEITTEPTCFEGGIKTYHCLNCEATKTGVVSALEHEIVLYTGHLADGSGGNIYYYCKHCGSRWAAVYNAETQEFDIPDETPLDPSAPMDEGGESFVPAPTFNIFTDESIHYNYNQRGASLRYAHQRLMVEQPLRFTASVKVPEGVDYKIGESGNAVVDVGYIFTQSSYIAGDLNQLVLEKAETDAYIGSLSVAKKNAQNGVFNGHNWGGITAHETADGIHLTFNIVIAVNAMNWQEEYCVRPYITYRYGGYEFTVYDHAFSTRSVADIAQCVVQNEAESTAARQFCENLLQSLGIM